MGCCDQGVCVICSKDVSELCEESYEDNENQKLAVIWALLGVVITSAVWGIVLASTDVCNTVFHTHGNNTLLL